MEHKMRQETGREGRLPAMAPLAYPFVPVQVDAQPQYEPRKALVRGTLFPDLDLPFMGMINKNEEPITPLTELQCMAFAIQELALYLDTHRDDKEALELYKMYQKMNEKARAIYEEKCGPLTHMSSVRGDAYQWLDDPWPWEYAAKREG